MTLDSFITNVLVLLIDDALNGETYRSLSLKTGISPSLICKWHQRKSTPLLHNAERLFEALGMSLTIHPTAGHRPSGWAKVQAYSKSLS